MNENKKQMIEKFQCPGCVVGEDTNCGKFNLEICSIFNTEQGFYYCKSHCIGTIVGGIGKILLGLPKGFNRIGSLDTNIQKVYLRFHEKAENIMWDIYNVAVWKTIYEGYLIVRTFCPRINVCYIDVFEKFNEDSCPNAIDVTDKIEEMD